MMNGDQLGDEIAQAFGYDFTSEQLHCWGRAIVAEVRHGVATFHLKKSGHKISGIVGVSMAGMVVSCMNYGFISRELNRFCDAIADHVMGSGIVTYEGPDTGTPPVDWFLGGKISGLSGPVLAGMVVDYVGYGYVTDRLLIECTVIVKHIMNNAEVTLGVIV